ncbi:hypothetical protein JB92DRAFT_1562871 [Gautieria morchelliformis]|nr:hypothetical protein JB92DRAFT_1562871 [Gautieria morchelliformis]
MGRDGHSRQPSKKSAGPPSIPQSQTPPAHNISISPTSTALLHVGSVNASTQSPHDVQLNSSQPTSTTFRPEGAQHNTVPQQTALSRHSVNMSAYRSTSYEPTNFPTANTSLNITSSTATNLSSDTTSSLLSMSSNVHENVSSLSSKSSGGLIPPPCTPLSASTSPQSAVRGPGPNDSLSSTRAPAVNAPLSGVSTRTSVPTA